MGKIEAKAPRAMALRGARRIARIVERRTPSYAGSLIKPKFARRRRAAN